MSAAPLHLPEGYTGRPLTADDAEAVAALLAAAEPLDDTGEHHGADDLTEIWVNDLVHLADDGRAVLTADDEVVGYATTVAPPTFRDAYGVHLEGRVHPEHRGRGLGRALLDWQLARGAELHAERHPGAPARLTVTAHTTMTSLAGILRHAGMQQLRWFHHMHRDLSDLPALRSVEGVALTPFSWDRDEQLRHAHNAAFTEHYGSSERDVASWRVMFTGQRAFRPDLTVLATTADEQLVGYAIGYVYASDTAATGREEVYYGQIGVVPAARGRGLSKAVIVQALHTAAASGVLGAALEVDNDNVTNALGLYESLGFATARTVVSWSRLIAPLPAGA